MFDNGEKKGLINLATFKQSIMTLGDKLAPEQVAALLKDAGIDESQEFVDYKAFMKLLKA